MKLFKKIFFVLLILNFSSFTNAKPVPESFADLAEKLMPSVVNISTTQTVRASSKSWVLAPSMEKVEQVSGILNRSLEKRSS